MKKLRIAVYCSASDNLDRSWTAAAERLGEFIAGIKADMIYGGVDAGLMRVVAGAVKKGSDSVVTGVVPMLRIDKASPLNDVQIPAEGLADRKANMYLMADVFVVLPGGYGTLDEMFSTLAYINFNGITTKRIILYNPDGLFDSLVAQLQQLVDKGLMKRGALEPLAVADDIEDVCRIISDFNLNYQQADEK